MQTRKRTLLSLVMLSSFALAAMIADIGRNAAGALQAKPQIAIESPAGVAVKDRTNQTSLKIRPAKPDEGWAITSVSAGKNGSVPVELKGELFDFTSFANQQEQQIVVKLAKGTESAVVRASLTFDTVGPMVSQVRLVGLKGADATLEVQFLDSDLDETQAKKLDNYKITRLAGSDKFADETGRKPGTPAIGPDGKIVLIKLTDMFTDNYQLEIRSELIDKAGNPAGFRDGKLVAEQRFYFSSYPERTTGQHVEFPDFVPRPKDAPGVFNPGDKVETRVVRLYYFRDAHRVAQIINRNVQSFNRAAVDLKRREASASRERADTVTDERRSKERAAVQAAQEARQVEHELERAEALAAQARAKAKQDADNLKTAQTQLDDAKRTKEDAEKALAMAKPEDKEAAKAELEAAKTQFAQASSAKDAAANAVESSTEDRRQKEADLKSAQAKLEVKRSVEIAKREESLQAEAREDRAREDQFRKEVAAAHEDPDTYVAAKVESPDSVTQVSVSVIGEGLIHLRGPIRGINKIRNMVDQIDSPVGQVKVGIFTVQVNGEHGDRMEKVAQRIEGNIDVSRFLTSQSMMLLRRAVQEVATEVAQQSERGGHYQVDRDRKYLYTFFGRDFIDELYAMDSEFLYSGNKVISLHSMDSVSRSNALFVMALARNGVRQRILDRFMHLVECELPQAEYDFRKASKVLPCNRNTRKEVAQKAAELYRFRSLRGMFDVPLADEHDDIMTPMQREFLRLAQIFKSQMLAEVELKQRVVERGLIEDRAGDEEEMDRLLEPAHRKANASLEQKFVEMADAQEKLGDAFVELGQVLLEVRRDYVKLNRPIEDVQDLIEEIASFSRIQQSDDEFKKKINKDRNEILNTINQALKETPALSEENKDAIRWYVEDVKTRYEADVRPSNVQGFISDVGSNFRYYAELLRDEMKGWEKVRTLFAKVRQLVESSDATTAQAEAAFEKLFDQINAQGTSPSSERVRRASLTAYQAVLRAGRAESNIERARRVSNRTRRSLDQKKLLDFLIDEKEEKWIDLREGTKAHIATMDNYLKRLAIALEDDFKVQFYDPAFAEIRKAAREWDVNLGQVERTTILTNNRAFAKVMPQATMEFDLPKRDFLLQEAFKGAKAMVEDYGALMQDPTFLAAAKMLSGSPTASVASAPRGSVGGLPSQGQPGAPVKSVLPGLPSSSEEQVLNQSTGREREIGAALEALIPDPAIYKFETGTGFEIRPVIQPDGDSVIYDFNYMYTTNVREPVRADEKHLGRVKRHFIDTQVQTSSFELREISRYQVTLKASRTSRGVPLFEDIPGLGVLFRPLPSDESSLQQNIILGQSVVYPTLFDLMGLRWAPHVAELDHTALRDQQHVVRGRRKTISDFVFDETSSRVDSFLGINDDSRYKTLRRNDLYREQDRPSPYHPNGYEQPGVVDPTREGFEMRDRRPPEMRQPPYDPRRGVPVEEEPLAPANNSSRSNPRGDRAASRPAESERLILTASDSANVVRASHETVSPPPPKKPDEANRPAAAPVEQKAPESDRLLPRLWKRVTGHSKE